MKTESSSSSTKFLSLDKIVKGRDFLQIMEIANGRSNVDGDHQPSSSSNISKKLYYDMDWLAVIKATHMLTPLDRNARNGMDEFPHASLELGREFIRRKFRGPDDEALLVVPLNFARTAPIDERNTPQAMRANPQTDAFYRLLELAHLPFTVASE